MSLKNLQAWGSVRALRHGTSLLRCSSSPRTTPIGQTMDRVKADFAVMRRLCHLQSESNVTVEYFVNANLFLLS